ncbi:MAG: site-2 protease family protein [Actinobacteria bacterium]|nr:site-2 protease family protein [Actinomycetota bacterium]
MIPRKGLRVGAFRGIDVFIHWSWFIVFALLLWVVLQFFQVNVSSGPAIYVPVALLTTLLFFASVLLHELSHSLVATRNGVPINRITLFVFGGVAQMGKDVTSPGVEFKMAVAGPLCSYLLCLLFGAFSYLAHQLGAETVSFGLMLLATVNFGLGTFNLVPGFPLDGGRILRSLLWHHWHDMERSTRAASRLGEVFGALMVTAGISMLLADLLRNRGDYILAGVWFILIGTFLVQAAENSFRQLRLRLALADATAYDLLRPGVPAVDLSATLEEVYRVHLERTPGAVIPVLRQGKLAGTVSMADLKKAAKSAWEETPVAAVARPLRPEDTCSSRHPLFEVMALMERSGRDFLWVTEEGRLLGVLLREDVRRHARERLRA